MPDKITLSVYFSGTGHQIDDHHMLAGVLHAETEVDEKNLKMGFNGCGVDFGFSGSIYGTGLEIQCKKVVSRIIPLLKAGKRVRLNAYGHSRGAIACLLLTKMLGNFDRDLIEINLALMDPVPGNFLTISAIDFTHQTLARQTMNVSQCRNLTHVLAIYPHRPLSSILAHAPLIPTYPSSCEVTEEIIPGGHAGAQFIANPKNYNNEIVGENRGSYITFLLISRFLAKLGTKFNFINRSVDQEKKADADLLMAYNKSFTAQDEKRQLLSRACHSKSSVTIETKWPATYLSPLHKKLKQQSTEMTSDEMQSENNDKQKQHEFAYLFSPVNFRKTKKLTAQVEAKLTLGDKIKLLAGFLDEIYVSGMTKKSCNSLKGSLIKKCIDTLNTSTPSFYVVDEAGLKDVMRNVMALCLQRDRNAYSPFSTTQSGQHAVSLLNSKKYNSLTKLILNGNDEKIRYRDLKTFVLGKNEEAYFNSKKSKSMYQFFQPSKDNSNIETKLFSNNMNFYLS